MASVNLHADHLPPGEKPKAEIELRWLLQESRRERPLLPRLVVALVLAAAFVGGLFWERGERLGVGLGAAALALAVAGGWGAVKFQRRRRFSREWEMTVLQWHAARAQIREAVRKQDAPEAAEQARAEAKLRARMAALLRRR